MNEIKFACPQCQQHIACSEEYADMIIVCPDCSQPMVVPVLTARQAARTEMCMVASKPTSKRTIQSRVPQLAPWTERDWEDNFQAVTGESAARTPYWLVSIFGTIILTAMLRAGGAAWIWITFELIAGTALSVYLMIKGGSFAGGYASAGETFGRIWLTALLLVLGLPVIALGLLFVGCGGCR
jgi:hypothetical protein